MSEEQYKHTPVWRGKIEPEATAFGSETALASIAISLKRIADSMDRMELMMQAEAESEPEPSWQPISTAPQGKKLLLFYKNSLGKGRRVFGKYYLAGELESLEGEACDEGWYEETETHEEALPVECEPTHWMPLPPEPELASGQ